jgi:hypothetical protein
MAKGKAPHSKASSSEVSTGLLGRTLVSYDARFGLQVEYFGKNGKTYFWYNGFKGLVTGSWKVDTIKSKKGEPLTTVCFKYKRNPVNPSINKTDKKFDCQLWFLNALKVVDIKTGDVFNLTSGNIPFVLPSKKLNIRRIKKLAR